VTQRAFWDTHAYFGQESVGASHTPAFNRTVIILKKYERTDKHS
tara:strand:- start:1156 stop:1287 length:132 start_codon:yes stop_codon:yes gene_type:complete